MTKLVSVLVLGVVACALCGCSGGSDATPAQAAKLRAALESKHQPTIEEEKARLAALSPEMREKVTRFIPHDKQVELGLAPK